MRLIVLPFLNNLDMTGLALDDALAQGGAADLHVLLIDNGNVEALEWGKHRAAADPRVLPWRHDPPLPSLSAIWNRALQFAWEAGYQEALVVNNDIRMWEGTYQYLAEVRRVTDALFVSATGVTPDQYETFLQEGTMVGTAMPAYPLPGPDFSCYLITRECHELYPFDEGYVPGYCEDLDYHRRLMLGGDGSRIFGTGLPFLHVGSGTLRAMSPEARAKWERRIEMGSRAHHQMKWGGPANLERFTIPWDPQSLREGVATQELFARVRVGEAAF